jgi:putative tryptophan/tyrosine transport system substrate-binding protein
MRRRTFIQGIAASTAWPLGARAQQPDRLHRIGVLSGIRPDDPDAQTEVIGLQEGFSTLGWREGRNLHIEWRMASGASELYERYAAELVALNCEVLVAIGSPSVKVLRQQTHAIPTVFAMVSDPVAQGFVDSLARPGGNITGFSNYEPLMAAKWLGMLTQITPPVERAAVLYNPPTAPFAGLMLRTIQEAAPTIGIAVRVTPFHDDAEIELLMTEFAHEERSGVLVLPDPFSLGHRDVIIASAARHRVPVIYTDRRYTSVGGLMSYGVDPADLFRRAATYVDRILKGAKPANLPVQAPTKFELVINLKTAKALGLTIPPSLLATADEVIE